MFCIKPVLHFRPGSVVVEFKVVINLPPGGVQLENGTVLVAVGSSGSRDDVASLIKDAIAASDDLNVDKNRIQAQGRLWVECTERVVLNIPS